MIFLGTQRDTANNAGGLTLVPFGPPLSNPLFYLFFIQKEKVINAKAHMPSYTPGMQAPEACCVS